jgi:hypothetical protein
MMAGSNADFSREAVTRGDDEAEDAEDVTVDGNSVNSDDEISRKRQERELLYLAVTY